MIERVLIIGSGPIVIGQAAEFDYSGTQACLACREAGVTTILVNSNPATIQTDPHVADLVYIEPLTVPSLENIIARERPDGIIATVGGQTGLNLAVALAEAGVLDRYGVRILGTGLDTIRRGEDRALFAATLEAIGEPILPSRAVNSVEDALQVAQEVGYPVMCRSAFALGGAGSGFATDPSSLVEQVTSGLAFSGSGQVLVERSVYGWAEVEYEVIRDSEDNCLIVCNMENLDPMGVHTGDSVVVAPSQTLSDDEYHRLRAAAMRVVRALGVEGACNVQFALHRESGDYYVIEVNPRLSRSSALASKATGYPIAKVATRIALGKSLPEIRNDITGTSAFFEPALDYVVLKIPRWPFDKFKALNGRIGTSMRSTGEVMAIGRSFEEAMSKALRSIDTPAAAKTAGDDMENLLAVPNGARFPAVLRALQGGWEPQRVAGLTGIDPWFIDRLCSLVRADAPMGDGAYKMVDTCAGEFEARTPYFYRSEMLGGQNEALPMSGHKAIILGAGPIRIGQGIEFDYATVHACLALTNAGVRSIVINNNPETVSTDYSTSDRLYFEPLDIEAVEAVVRNEGEGLLGVIPQFGGQTAINLVTALQARGIRILGTQPCCIDAAEDRGRASEVLSQAGIPTPPWRAVEHWDDVHAAAAELGFPVLLRPSYVLSGSGMIVARSAEDVETYLQVHAGTPLLQPLLVDKFLEGAVELNVDAVSDGHDTLAVIMEQLDECGVHSGDSAEVYPPQTISPDILRTVQCHTRTIARAFEVVGLVNVQYAVQDGHVYVLEVNPRASRSVPFASKASGVPLADLAVRAILGERLSAQHIDAPRTDRISVKNVVFPFRVFPGLDPILGPEMQSTGESMGTGATFAAAYWKAWLGAGLRDLPFGQSVYISAPLEDADTTACLVSRLHAVGCRVVLSPETSAADDMTQRRAPGSPNVTTLDRSAPEDLDVSTLGLVIVLGRTRAEIGLLRRAVDARVAAISTHGSFRALIRVLKEGMPDLGLEADRDVADLR